MIFFLETSSVEIPLAIIDSPVFVENRESSKVKVWENCRMLSCETRDTLENFILFL